VFSQENGLPVRELSTEALRIMMDYGWPGNVRELENAMERAVVLSRGPNITPDLLPSQLRGQSYSTALLEENSSTSLFDVMEEIERRIIADRLERCNWNQTEAAEYFRIPLSTLNQKIKRLSVEVKRRHRE
jgi:DNA-binding NtrC family response regulator